uniref:Uncharacterized protein n=1 Tax=Anopheles maculatus TaxID=74869 RepID=A0A182SZX2_9DIPT
CTILPLGPILLQPFKYLNILFRHGLYYKIIAPFQRIVRMIGTVTVCVCEPHLTVCDRTDERPLASMEPLVNEEKESLNKNIEFRVEPTNNLTFGRVLVCLSRIAKRVVPQPESQTTPIKTRASLAIYFGIGKEIGNPA